MKNIETSKNFGGGTPRPKKTLIKFMTNTWKMHQQLQKMCEMHTRNLESGSKNMSALLRKRHSAMVMSAAIRTDRRAV